MLRVAICDDDEQCRIDTKCLLDRWAAATATQLKIDSFDNGDALIAKCGASKFDILFLDIVMPLLNGMDTAKELRDKDKTVMIVFLTASPEFALQSYSVKAADYCIKPITYERMAEIMDDCMAQRHHEADHLTLKTLGGYQKIYHHDIEYIEAQNKRVIFYLNSGKPVEVIQPLYTFEAQLTDSKGFFKCHRSYLVFLPNVDYFSNTEIKTKSGRSVPIARGYAKNFQEAYFSLLFQE